MRKFTLRERLRYAFDNTLSRGPLGLIAWLAAASALIIVGVALVVRLFQLLRMDDSAYTVPQLVWMGLMRTLDSGTMGGDEGSPGFLLAMLLVTLAGIFVISALIGIITAALENRLDKLRKGRSTVVEHGHTVILGWSEHVFPVIAELAEANRNQRKSCVVVLGPKDKVEMEDEVASNVPNRGRMRVVCRTGSPTDVADLAIANLPDAKGIIVLAPEEMDPDAQVIKTLLAITNHPERRPAPYHIVAELRDPRNVAVAELASRGEAELVLVGDLVARVIAQTCRQSGLSVVYGELLDFAGDEIYFHAEPALVGQTLASALVAYADSSVIGLVQAGQSRLLPPLDTVIGPADQLILITADDDTARLADGPSPAPDEAAIALRPPAPAEPEHTLLLGWNWRAPRIINELDAYVAPGSTITVVAGSERPAADIAVQCADLRHQTTDCRVADTTDRGVLDGLRPGAFHHVIVLADSDDLTAEQADARTLVTLLHLRDIEKRRGEDLAIVSEMLDIRNRDLAEVTHADDFIVSDRLVSLLLAQVSENRALNAVFRDLYDPEGAEVYLKPVTDYLVPGRAVTFYTAVEAARRHREIAIGYRLVAQAEDAAAGYGVVVNPDKREIVTFGLGDKLVVVAES